MRKLMMVVVAAAALALPVNAFAATTTVSILAKSFNPTTAKIDAGDTVTWVNKDTATHQIVADRGTFASAVLKPGQSYSHTFKNGGTYAYHDALHPTIKGTVSVKGAPASVTLGAQAPIVVYGTSTTVTGTVSNGAAGESVTLTASPYGSTAQQVLTTTTGTGGGFAFTVNPNILTTYTATWKGATSQQVTIQVRPKLSLIPYHGRFWARVSSPVSYAGHYIYLQRRSPFGQWVTVSKLKLGSLSGRIFSMPATKGRWTYRVYMSVDQAGSGYLDGWSGTQTVTHR